jgi:hypothetical protein
METILGNACYRAVQNLLSSSVLPRNVMVIQYVIYTVVIIPARFRKSVIQLGEKYKITFSLKLDFP